MIINGYVISDIPDEYTSGKGKHVKTQKLTVIDQDAVTEARLTQTIQYSMSDEEKERYAGKTAGRTCKLAVTSLEIFGGQLRCRGKIIEIAGVDGNGAPKKPATS
jgi:hypothetical protein